MKDRVQFQARAKIVGTFISYYEKGELLDIYKLCDLFTRELVTTFAYRIINRVRGAIKDGT